MIRHRETIRRDWSLHVDADAVLRGQQADPAVVRARSPRVVVAAERAVAEGRSLLAPVVGVAWRPVRALHHERLLLAEGGRLTGPLVARHLAAAEAVVALVATVGDGLERYAAACMADDPALALALDAFGTAAVEALAAAACAWVEAEAAAAGRQVSLPLSPGLSGWPVDTGQRELFGLLDAGALGVARTAAGLMVPRKSVSLLLGVGRDLRRQGRVCDLCSLQATCRHEHYERSAHV